MTRRDFFSNLYPSRWSNIVHAARDDAPAPDAPTLAVIAGRHCLAYQGTFCSTCRERCPVAGAIVVSRGLPQVNPELCNGCRFCHDVCPAPVNAIRLVHNRTVTHPSPTAAHA